MADVAKLPHDVALPTGIAAQILQVSDETVRRWLRSGKLRSLSLGDVLACAGYPLPRVAKSPHDQEAGRDVTISPHEGETWRGVAILPHEEETRKGVAILPHGEAAWKDVGNSPHEEEVRGSVANSPHCGSRPWRGIEDAEPAHGPVTHEALTHRGIQLVEGLGEDEVENQGERSWSDIPEEPVRRRGIQLVEGLGEEEVEGAVPVSGSRGQRPSWWKTPPPGADPKRYRPWLDPEKQVPARLVPKGPNDRVVSVEVCRGGMTVGASLRYEVLGPLPDGVDVRQVDAAVRQAMLVAMEGVLAKYQSVSNR